MTGLSSQSPFGATRFEEIRMSDDFNIQNRHVGHGTISTWKTMQCDFSCMTSHEWIFYISMHLLSRVTC
jgi:hypothetical protein